MITAYDQTGMAGGTGFGRLLVAFFLALLLTLVLGLILEGFGLRKGSQDNSYLVCDRTYLTL